MELPLVLLVLPREVLPSLELVQLVGQPVRQ
jgi:hypothetical protein